MIDPLEITGRHELKCSMTPRVNDRIQVDRPGWYVDDKIDKTSRSQQPAKTKAPGADNPSGFKLNPGFPESAETIPKSIKQVKS